MTNFFKQHVQAKLYTT